MRVARHLEDLYGDPLRIWKDWATEVRGFSIKSGHHMAEEAPDEVDRELLSFLTGAAQQL